MIRSEVPRLVDAGEPVGCLLVFQTLLKGKGAAFPAQILCVPSHPACLPLGGAIGHCRPHSWAGSLDLESIVSLDFCDSRNLNIQ